MATKKREKSYIETLVGDRAKFLVSMQEQKKNIKETEENFIEKFLSTEDYDIGSFAHYIIDKNGLHLKLIEDGFALLDLKKDFFIPASGTSSSVREFEGLVSMLEDYASFRTLAIDYNLSSTEYNYYKTSLLDEWFSQIVHPDTEEDEVTRNSQVLLPTSKFVKEVLGVAFEEIGLILDIDSPMYVTGLTASEITNKTFFKISIPEKIISSAYKKRVNFLSRRASEKAS